MVAVGSAAGLRLVSGAAVVGVSTVLDVAALAVLVTAVVVVPEAVVAGLAVVVSSVVVGAGVGGEVVVSVVAVDQVTSGIASRAMAEATATTTRPLARPRITSGSSHATSGTDNSTLCSVVAPRLPRTNAHSCRPALDRAAVPSPVPVFLLLEVRCGSAPTERLRGNGAKSTRSASAKPKLSPRVKDTARDGSRPLTGAFHISTSDPGLREEPRDTAASPSLITDRLDH